jgi:putative hemolysin
VTTVTTTLPCPHCHGTMGLVVEAKTIGAPIRLLSTANSFTEGMQNAAPCYCMQRSFLLWISFNGKQFHANRQWVHSAN